MRVLQSKYTQLGLSQKSRSLLNDGDDGDLGDEDELDDDDDAIIGWAGHFRQVSDRGGSALTSSHCLSSSNLSSATNITAALVL